MFDKKRKKSSLSLKLKIATNLALCTLVVSIGALCLSPLSKEISTKGEDQQIYRSAGENAAGVSLMFNVYWGTDEVYRILEILQAHEAKATFFIGGSWADDNVACLKAIHEKGHEIGNHGYFHKDHKKLSVAENEKEISNCNRFIELAIGEKVTLFAPPSGSYGDTMLTACKTLGMKTVLWSKDTIDWRDKNAKIIYTRATKNVKKGDFILMHPMAETADALELVLNYYENNSLKTVTVSENLQEKV
ncbi:MAG: polysaccharide deacetylase family protein [Clostridia bacterium]|nr:polysaccharide deacetylase family protein [Clostridia bacterium]